MRKGKSLKTNVNKGLKAFFLGLIIIGFLGVILTYNLKTSNENLEKLDRYAVIGKENIFVIYENKLAIRIPQEIQVDKNISFQELLEKKNYEEVLNSLNRLLPEKINSYKVVKYGEMHLDVKNAKNIPETVIDEKRYILTSSMHSMFDSLYRENSNRGTGELIIDILNANGRAGYAKITGEKLKKKLPITYTAANYEKNSDYSLLIINEAEKSKMEELIMQVDEKYFKIADAGSIPTLANAVLVLGKEQANLLDIYVIGNDSSASDAVSQLKNHGYKNIKTDKKKSNVEVSVIQYHPDDYYIAYKIGKKLNINNMIEKNDLRNKINILFN
ncbi:LytR family transcriptional regulator [Cetobacterium sp. 2A]|uniref:LytR family transcriptional regulator n=1 Tax=Cetobacterium sp. 2A TaxID=2754723 RepID=UPI00163BB37A|nr:LytR family transcriptional regulator [Cetobacterium sp. 2A]MBC2856088.1 LytR family transcriptional regulator [Cetobacterium sp. 2A]